MSFDPLSGRRGRAQVGLRRRRGDPRRARRATNARRTELQALSGLEALEFATADLDGNGSLDVIALEVGAAPLDHDPAKTRNERAAVKFPGAIFAVLMAVGAALGFAIYCKHQQRARRLALSPSMKGAHTDRRTAAAEKLFPRRGTAGSKTPSSSIHFV